MNYSIYPLLIPLLLNITPGAIASEQSHETEKPTSALVLYFENDEYYTNAVKLRIPSGTGQFIYTSKGTKICALQKGKRPYAGYLYGFLALHAKQAQRMDAIELTAGIVEPSALGEPAQNEAHRMPGLHTAKGWNSQLRDKSVAMLSSVSNYSLSRCAEFVGNAIEAGGIPLNRGLNPTPKNSAYGYGPVLENAGFSIMPIGTVAQAGDVAIFPPVPNHPHGHATMFDGQTWWSDFRQIDIYASAGYRDRNAPYTLYRSP